VQLAHHLLHHVDILRVELGNTFHRVVDAVLVCNIVRLVDVLGVNKRALFLLELAHSGVNVLLAEPDDLLCSF